MKALTTKRAAAMTVAAAAALGAAFVPAATAAASAKTPATQTIRGHLIESSDFGWATGYVSIDKDFRPDGTRLASDMTTCRAANAAATSSSLRRSNRAAARDDHDHLPGDRKPSASPRPGHRWHRRVRRGEGKRHDRRRSQQQGPQHCGLDDPADPLRREGRKAARPGSGSAPRQRGRPGTTARPGSTSTVRRADGPVVVSRGGNVVSGVLDSRDAAFSWLLRHQGNSVTYAIKHGGYRVAPAPEPAKRRRRVGDEH